MFNIALEETWLDFPSNDAHAVAVVMTGCPHNCKECHSPGLQPCKTYTETPQELRERIVNFTRRSGTNKIVLTGGDCLFAENLKITKTLISELKDTHEITVYTGYDIESVKKMQLEGVDYFKCGKYIPELAQKPEKTENYMALASTNQCFYNNSYTPLSKNGVLHFN